MEVIEYKENGVCTLTLNRPDVFNSFNRNMAFQLQQALDECSLDDSIRVVVLKGEGNAFCAGQDLKEALDPNGPNLKSILAEH
jgi:2-(1,2-epoxy-1,2-dihydrophenyl)acetyl-CoA isomerase